MITPLTFTGCPESFVGVNFDDGVRLGLLGVHVDMHFGHHIRA